MANSSDNQKQKIIDDLFKNDLSDQEIQIKLIQLFFDFKKGELITQDKVNSIVN